VSSMLCEADTSRVDYVKNDLGSDRGKEWQLRHNSQTDPCVFERGEVTRRLNLQLGRWTRIRTKVRLTLNK
jgi:hypothetical protein